MFAPMPLTEQEFQALLPKITGWIDLRLRLYRTSARTVASAGFKRLPDYFPKAILETAHFIVVPEVPKPPLKELGLVSEEFAEFVDMVPDGITYKTTYFVRTEAASRESLHFHELIHVVQWLELGHEPFVRMYASGLAIAGYRESPLEVMAYDAEKRFKESNESFDAVRYVRGKLATL